MRRLFALILVIALWVGFSPSASADISGLTPCRDSAAFAQRIKESQNANASRRYELYSKAGLLCGADGLPHLITDGRLSHAGEIIIPSVLFLYLAGWLGWAGRTYLNIVRFRENPEYKEIQIDVPLAIQCFATALIWPLTALKEIVSGEIQQPDDKIPVSPR